jgi:hypothetical protein
LAEIFTELEPLPASIEEGVNKAPEDFAELSAIEKMRCVS